MTLTLHCDASDTGNLFTTLNGGGSGVHTGTPSDGSSVAVWNDEGDGITDVILRSSVGQEPLWRSTTPLLVLPCVDFSGTAQSYGATNQSGVTAKAISTVIAAGACTVIVAFYAESITSTFASYQAHGLINDDNGLWGIFLKNVSGQRKAVFYNYDGSEDYIDTNISENTPYVLMARHDAGNLYLSINGGTEVSVASGNTQALTTHLLVGGGGLAQLFNGRIGEFKIWNTGNADGAGNVATQIAAMVSKWVTPAGTSTPLALSASLTLAGQIAKRLNKPFAGVI